MSKRTPAPWTVADYKTMGTKDRVVLSPDHGPDDPHPVVASVINRPGYAANARLIAAAPELLAALMAVLSDLEHREPDGWMSGNVHQSAYTAALAAIAKAEGRS